MFLCQPIFIVTWRLKEDFSDVTYSEYKRSKNKEMWHQCHLQLMILLFTKSRFLLAFTTFPIPTAVLKYIKRLHFHIPGVQRSTRGLMTCLTTLQAVHTMVHAGSFCHISLALVFEWRLARCSLFIAASL